MRPSILAGTFSPNGPAGCEPRSASRGVTRCPRLWVTSTRARRELGIDFIPTGWYFLHGERLASRPQGQATRRGPRRYGRGLGGGAKMLLATSASNVASASDIEQTERRTPRPKIISSRKSAAESCKQATDPRCAAALAASGREASAMLSPHRRRPGVFSRCQAGRRDGPSVATGLALPELRVFGRMESSASLLGAGGRADGKGKRACIGGTDEGTIGLLQMAAAFEPCTLRYGAM